MFCPGCGEKNDDGCACCSRCGIDLARIRVLISEGKQDTRDGRNGDALLDETAFTTDSSAPASTITDPGIPGIVDLSQPGSSITGISDPVQLKERGNELFREERFLDALDCYEKALAIDQFYTEAWYNKAIVLKKIGYLDQSKVCWGIYKRLSSERTEKQ